jgi:hypothetical protein
MQFESGWVQLNAIRQGTGRSAMERVPRKNA